MRLSARTSLCALGFVTASLACGGTGGGAAGGAPTAAAPDSKYDLSTLSGTWCHVDGYCYTYTGGAIVEENSGLKGTWHQEGDLYISQFGEDVPWVAKIEMYTATQLVLVPFDDNERIVYSKR